MPYSLNAYNNAFFQKVLSFLDSRICNILVSHTQGLQILSSYQLLPLCKRGIVKTDSNSHLQYFLQKTIYLVFVTKYRKKVFSKQILADLKEIFTSVCNDFESPLAEFEGEGDHVHLLINYPPKVAVSKLLNSLKGVFSRFIRKKKHPSIHYALWRNSLWSPSYFAGACGGAPTEVMRQYIEQQQSPEH